MQQADKIMADLGKSLVTIHLVDALVAPQGDRLVDRKVGSRTFTGFLLEVGPEWFVCTAGHVMEFIREASDGTRKIVKLQIGYGFQGVEARHLLIEKIVVAGEDDRRSGLDIAMLDLSLAHRATLASVLTSR